MSFNYRQEFHRYKQYYFKFQQLSARPFTKASISLLLSLLMISFFSIFAIKPSLATIAGLTKEIQDKKKLNSQMETKIISLKKAETAYEELVPKLPLIESVLPKKPEFERLEQEIEYLAWKNQVIFVSGSFSSFMVTGVEPADIKENDQSQKKEESAFPTDNIKLSFSITGSYSDLKNFITDLEYLDRVVFIENVEFSKETNTEKTELQVTLDGRAFYKPSINENKE